MLEGKNINPKSPHKVMLISRENLTVEGIREIINFDENEVNLRTVCGDMTVEGEGMHVNVLNVAVGEIELIGKINGIYYFDRNDNEKRSLLSKIFK